MTIEALIPYGIFCWAELYAKDIVKSSEFYSSLFDWKIETIPLDKNESYTMFKVKNNNIAGGMQLSENMGDLRPHWNSYVLVNDIHESVAAAKALGAKVPLEIRDVSNMGKMAVIIDPTGGAFSLWQSTQSNEAVPLPKTTPGTIGWNELVTEDTELASRFYTDLFKWTINTKEWLPGETYTTFMNQGKPIAGMRTPTKKLNTAGPRWWLYFTVADLNKAIDQAKKSGGSVGHETTIILGLGRFAMIQDPNGICFSMIEFD